VVSAALLLAARLAPSDASDLPRTFKSGVDLVFLDVGVRDPSDGFMADLAADDFLVVTAANLVCRTRATPAWPSFGSLAPGHHGARRQG
jgi:hypothetical protein